MTASTAQINIRQTYLELAKTSGDFERALKACNRILKAAPNEDLALHCKLVCLIQLSKFDEGLQLVRKAPNPQNLAFEKAYCEYRLNRTDEAIRTLQAVSSDGSKLDFRCQELMAQLLYRTEQFEECYDIYKDLLKNSQDDYDETRRANLAAVAAQMTMKSPESNVDPAVSTDSYEQCFNEACRLSASGKFKQAKLLLEKAEKTCRRALTEDEATEEEIDEELAGIRTQLAYCLQMMGDGEQAVKLYNDIIKQKPKDLGLLAVASNNAISIRKEQNLFDARKKMKNCTTSQVEQKLSRYQKGVICLNNALILLHSNQLEPCRRAVEDLRQRYPGFLETAVLCEAALLARQKDASGAAEVLKKYIASVSSTGKKHSLAVDLALAQMYLLDGQQNRAIELLRSLGDDVQYQPGILSLLVALNLSDDTGRKAALEVLSNGVDCRKRRKHAADDPQLPTLIEECASLYARFGDQKTATKYLEDLRQMKPNDPAILGRLMNAYVQFDTKKAEEVSRALPPLGRLTHDLDVDALESAGWLVLGSKYGAKKGTRTAAGDTPQPGTDDGGLAKKRRHKKKKKRLPKNYDPNGPPPDPERWLPKYERTAFKKRKDKRQKERDIGRGTQGAVGGGAELDSTAAQGPASPSPKPVKPQPPAAGAGAGTAAAPGPRQLRPGVQKQKPKKKGKGGNW